jgi:hypothetical protein
LTPKEICSCGETKIEVSEEMEQPQGSYQLLHWSKENISHSLEEGTIPWQLVTGMRFILGVAMNEGNLGFGLTVSVIFPSQIRFSTSKEEQWLTSQQGFLIQLQFLSMGMPIDGASTKTESLGL